MGRQNTGSYQECFAIKQNSEVKESAENLVTHSAKPTTQEPRQFPLFLSTNLKRHYQLALRWHFQESRNHPAAVGWLDAKAGSIGRSTDRKQIIRFQGTSFSKISFSSIF